MQKKVWKGLHMCMHTHVHTHTGLVTVSGDLFVCSAKPVPLLDVIHQQASSHTWTREPWKECWLHGLAVPVGQACCCIDWNFEKKQKLGHKLKLKELLESLCCPPDKFY